MHKGGGCIMATNSRNNNNVNVMAEELGIHDNANSSQPSLSFYATGDGGYPSTEQKPKPLKERIKENWEAFKATLKTTKGKLKFAGISVAAIIALIGLSFSIAAVVERVDYDNTIPVVTQQVASLYDETTATDLTDKLNYVIDSESATEEEKSSAQSLLGKIQDTKEAQEAIFPVINGAEDLKVKNIFKANKMLKQVEKGDVNPISSYQSDVDQLYKTVLAREEGIEEGKEEGTQIGENATVQQIVQAIIDGNYGNNLTWKNIANIKVTIDGRFADANGNDIADIKDAINRIKDSDLQSDANEIYNNMLSERDQANEIYGILKSQWSEFLKLANAGQYNDAWLYYKDNGLQETAREYADLSFNMHEEKIDIEDLVEQDNQLQAQQTTIEGTFSESELSSYLTYFKGAGIKGTIDNVNYVYNKETGEVQIVVNSTVNSQAGVTVLTFTTSAGYKDVNAVSIIDAHQDASAVSKSTYTMSNGTVQGALVVSNGNGTSQEVPGNNFKIGYSQQLSYVNGRMTGLFEVIVQGEDGQVHSLGTATKTLSAEELGNLDETIQSIVSNEVNSSPEFTPDNKLTAGDVGDIFKAKENSPMSTVVDVDESTYWLQ